MSSELHRAAQTGQHSEAHLSEHGHPEHDHHDHAGCGHDHHHHDHDHDHGAGEMAVAEHSFFSGISAILLMLWGTVMVYFFATSKITYYLTESGWFRGQTLVAGLGLFVVALFCFLTHRVKVSCGHEHSHDEADQDAHAHSHDHTCDDACDHDHAHEGDDDHHHHHDEETVFGKLVVFLILALPISAAAAYTTHGYSDQFLSQQLDATVSTMTAVGEAPEDVSLRRPGDPATGGAKSSPDKKTGSNDPNEFTLDDLKVLVPTSDEGNLVIKVVELFYTAGDKEIQRVIEGQGVETLGRVVADKVNNPDGNRLRVFEMVMECCAADARPFSIPVQFADGLPEFREMGWYKVIGKMEYRMEGGLMVPVMMAEKLVPTKAPKNRLM